MAPLIPAEFATLWCRGAGDPGSWGESTSPHRLVVGPSPPEPVSSPGRRIGRRRAAYVATRRVSRAVSLLTAAAVSIAVVAVLPGTGMAEPDLTIEEVQSRVDALYEEAEAATERAHDATVEVEQHQAAARAHREAAGHAAEAVRPALRGDRRLRRGDVRRWRHRPDGAAMMLSAEPDQFLMQSQVLDQVTSSQDEQLAPRGDRAAGARPDADPRRPGARAARSPRGEGCQGEGGRGRQARRGQVAAGSAQGRRAPTVGRPPGAARRGRCRGLA